MRAPVVASVSWTVPSPGATIGLENVYDGLLAMSWTFPLATRLGTFVGWVCKATGMSNGLVIRGATVRFSTPLVEFVPSLTVY